MLRVIRSKEMFLSRKETDFLDISCVELTAGCKFCGRLVVWMPPFNLAIYGI